MKTVLSLAVRTFGLLLVCAAVAGMAHADGGTCDAPEIDPSAVGGALTLLTGGLLLLTDRLRRK